VAHPLIGDAAACQRQGGHQLFVGNFEHQLDDKGRVVLPAAFRAYLAEGGYIARDGRQCLCVFTREVFQEEGNRMLDKSRKGEISRDEVTRFGSSASELKLDPQGRIAIPANLREHARLEERAALSVVGALDRIEIWDADTFRSMDAA
jgi:MraZ protein